MDRTCREKPASVQTGAGLNRHGLRWGFTHIGGASNISRVPDGKTSTESDVPTNTQSPAITERQKHRVAMREGRKE